MEVAKLKSLMKGMYDICDQINEKTNFSERFDLEEQVTVSKILMINTLHYLAYLSASDGVISWKECRFIGDILDLHITSSSLNNVIHNSNIYSTEFEETVPVCLQIFVSMDNAMYQSGLGDDSSVSEALFELYRVLVVGIEEANGRTAETMDPTVEKDARAYLTMMRKYMDDNLEKDHTDILFDMDKHGEKGWKTVDLGTFTVSGKEVKKSGSVKAPKKGI